MTRPKTISDEDILAVARKAFRAHGHGISTREIAQAAGISEGVLYQRFGSKDELFFQAVAPTTPDLEAILGPDEPVEARRYMRDVTARMNDYFGDVLPLAIRLITHPSFEHRSLGRVHVAISRLQSGLTQRLGTFERRGALRAGCAETAARVLVSLAHDRALGRVLSPGQHPDDLESMVDLVWEGARTGRARRR